MGVRTTPKDVLRAAIDWKKAVDAVGGRKACADRSLALYDVIDNFMTTAARDKIEKEVFDDPDASEDR